MRWARLGWADPLRDPEESAPAVGTDGLDWTVAGRAGERASEGAAVAAGLRGQGEPAPHASQAGGRAMAERLLREGIRKFRPQTRKKKQNAPLPQSHLYLARPTSLESSSSVELERRGRSRHSHPIPRNVLSLVGSHELQVVVSLACVDGRRQRTLRNPLTWS